jgi:hypothetical protein
MVRSTTYIKLRGLVKGKHTLKLGKGSKALQRLDDEYEKTISRMISTGATETDREKITNEYLAKIDKLGEKKGVKSPSQKSFKVGC